MEISQLFNSMIDRNEETLPNIFSSISDFSSHSDEESWCIGYFNQDSILPQHLELDQSQIFDKLASFHFKEIEPDCECEPNPQLCDSDPIFESMLTPVSLPNLDPILELTLIPTPIDLEIKSHILDSHIPLMEKECEFQFFNLNPTFEPSPTLESKLDLSHILEPVLVAETFILEPKSTIPPSHILLLD